MGKHESPKLQRETDNYHLGPTLSCDLSQFKGNEGMKESWAPPSGQHLPLSNHPQFYEKNKIE